MTAYTGDLGERIAALPGADRLLPALRGLAPAYLVGGALRDLLRGEDSVDLDVAVEGDAPAAARELAARLEGEALEHERFGTATVRADGLVLDLATTRRERYPRPGALPEVEPAPLIDDLARRDFTVNAMAAALAPVELGRLHDPHGGVPDLGAKAVRVLHYRSFVDDPTRLLRAVRYEVRLGFAMDPETEALAREAAEQGALATVSGPRVRDELLGLLGEPEPAAAAERLRMLGLDRALHRSLSAEPDLVAGAALGAAETGADRVLAALAALVTSDPEALSSWLGELGIDRDSRERVLRAARGGPALAGELRDELPASRLHELLSGEPPEALAVALACGAPGEPVLHYLADLRGVRLEITGDDLRDQGVPESPAIGQALAGTLRRKLDGEVSGRDEELRTAIELARPSGG
jgi:tRNA nucleotidyltransferase (CCA-adding enzyme)